MVLFDTAILEALGMSLIHVFWQGLLLGLIVRLLWVVIPIEQSLARYWISLSSLGVLLICWVTNVYLQWPAEVLTPAQPSDTVLFLAPEAISYITDSSSTGILPILEQWSPHIALAWYIGLLLFSARFLGELYWLHRLRRSIDITSIPLLAHLQARTGIQKIIRFGHTNRIQTPVTIGHLRPYILFPIGLINQLSPAEVEAILLHELAHIQRHDYLVNWLQTVVETLLFFHPITWWLSREIQAAREHCCDDLALRWSGQQPHDYAQTILDLSRREATVKHTLTMAMIPSKSTLTVRIQRLFSLPPRPFYRRSVLTGLSLCLSMFLLAAASLQTEPDVPEEYLTEASPAPIVALDTIPDDEEVIEIRVIGPGDEDRLPGLLDSLPTEENKHIIRIKRIISDSLPTEAEMLHLKVDDAQLISDTIIMIHPKTYHRDSTIRIQGPPFPNDALIDTIIIMKQDEKVEGNRVFIRNIEDEKRRIFFQKEDQEGTSEEFLFDLGKENLFLQNPDEKETIILNHRRDGQNGSDKAKPLFFIDGAEVKEWQIRKLVPEDIETIEVLKGEKAIETHGQRGENGIVEITTKDRPSIKLPENMDLPEFDLQKYLKRVDAKVYVVDGQEVERNQIKGYAPADIDSIRVLKGKVAAKNFGSRARNGVVEIFTTDGTAKLPPEGKLLRKGNGSVVVIRLNDQTETTGSKKRPTDVVEDIATPAPPSTQTTIAAAPDELLKKVQLFPNPTDAEAILQFELPQAQLVSVNLLNLEGRLIRQVDSRQRDAGPQQLTIGMSDLPNGTYLVAIEVADNRTVLRLNKN